MTNSAPEKITEGILQTTEKDSMGTLLQKEATTNSSDVNKEYENTKHTKSTKCQYRPSNKN